MTNRVGRKRQEIMQLSTYKLERRANKQADLIANKLGADLPLGRTAKYARFYRMAIARHNERGGQKIRVDLDPESIKGRLEEIKKAREREKIKRELEGQISQLEKTVNLFLEEIKKLKPAIDGLANMELAVFESCPDNKLESTDEALKLDEQVKTGIENSLTKLENDERSILVFIEACEAKATENGLTDLNGRLSKCRQNVEGKTSGTVSVAAINAETRSELEETVNVAGSEEYNTLAAAKERFNKKVELLKQCRRAMNKKLEEKRKRDLYSRAKDMPQWAEAKINDGNQFAENTETRLDSDEFKLDGFQNVAEADIDQAKDKLEELQTALQRLTEETEPRHSTIFSAVKQAEESAKVANEFGDTALENQLLNLLSNLRALENRLNLFAQNIKAKQAQIGQLVSALEERTRQKGKVIELTTDATQGKFYNSLGDEGVRVQAMDTLKGSSIGEVSNFGYSLDNAMNDELLLSVQLRRYGITLNVLNSELLGICTIKMRGEKEQEEGGVSDPVKVNLSISLDNFLRQLTARNTLAKAYLIRHGRSCQDFVWYMENFPQFTLEEGLEKSGASVPMLNQALSELGITVEIGTQAAESTPDSVEVNLNETVADLAAKLTADNLMGKLREVCEDFAEQIEWRFKRDATIQYFLERNGWTPETINNNPNIPFTVTGTPIGASEIFEGVDPAAIEKSSEGREFETCDRVIIDIDGATTVREFLQTAGYLLPHILAALRQPGGNTALAEDLERIITNAEDLENCYLADEWNKDGDISFVNAVPGMPVLIRSGNLIPRGNLPPIVIIDETTTMDGLYWRVEPNQRVFIQAIQDSGDDKLKHEFGEHFFGQTDTKVMDYLRSLGYCAAEINGTRALPFIVEERPEEDEDEDGEDNTGLRIMPALNKLQQMWLLGYRSGARGNHLVDLNELETEGGDNEVAYYSGYRGRNCLNYFEENPL